MSSFRILSPNNFIKEDKRMCRSALAIYCFIDDFLKVSGHQEDVRAEVTDAEVITIALTAMLHFGGNFEKSRLVVH